MQTNYELGAIQPGEPRLRDQRYRFGYNTQCCGFQLEVLNRNFVGSSNREFRFLINLKGVGNVVDFQSGSAGALPGTYPGGVPWRPARPSFLSSWGAAGWPGARAARARRRAFPG